MLHYDIIYYFIILSKSVPAQKSILSASGGVPPQSITFSRGKMRLLYINLYCYTRTSGGVPPQSITFSRGKTRLLYINLHCYARTSGAAAHERRFSTSADTPLTVRFTAIVSKFTSSFFYQALPHLIYSLFRVDKMFGLQSERNGVSDNANWERRHCAANWERRHSAGWKKCLTNMGTYSIIIKQCKAEDFTHRDVSTKTEVMLYGKEF